MLLEPVHYYKNLNFAIEFSNVAEEAPHYHRETEMALVLRGSATYKIHHQEFHLKAGDALVVDTQDLHRITDSSEDVIMLLFYINMEAFTDLYPNIDFMIFACEEFNQDASERHQNMQNKISFLIHHMAQMMFLRQNKDTADQLMVEKLQEILYLMVNHFQGFFIENREFRSGHDDANPADLDRLYRIITYMYRNYDKKLTLEDVANMEHLSMYYASHLIKKLSGLSFQNLLNYIRVECSEKLLNEDKYTLTQISDLCGFSSLAYYNKCFKTWHGMTPAQYKKLPKPSARSFHRPFDHSEAMMLLEPYLNAKLPQQDEDDNRFSSNHIFIPIHENYAKEAPLRKLLPLNIVLDSSKNLGEYSELILPLNPDSITVKEAIPNCGLTFSNAAQAFEYLIKERAHLIALHDRYTGVALLTSDDLPTPFYAVHKALSAIEGDVCEQQNQYILVKGESTVSIILFNTNERRPLHVYLQFNHNDMPPCMIRKDIGPENCVDALRKIAHTELLKPYIFELTSGTSHLIKSGDSGSLRINLTVEPGVLTIVTFPDNQKTVAHR